MEGLDITQIRSEFPILNRTVCDKPMVYLDSAATSFTPQCVVDEITRVYTTCKANVHRGVHTLSQEATDLQEATRESVISVEGDVVVSCLKQSYAGETVVRIFNPYEESRAVKFSKEVTLTNMKEELCGEKVTELTLAPKKIVTVKF